MQTQIPLSFKIMHYITTNITCTWHHSHQLTQTTNDVQRMESNPSSEQEVWPGGKFILILFARRVTAGLYCCMSPDLNWNCDQRGIHRKGKGALLSTLSSKPPELTPLIKTVVLPEYFNISLIELTKSDVVIVGTVDISAVLWFITQNITKSVVGLGFHRL